MKIMFASLGCDKNLVDSEEMLGILGREGYSFTDDETEADVIVVNTCCFIGDAKEESISTILEMAEYRRQGSCKALIVTGCLAQRYRQEVLDEIPEVDAVLGTMAYEEIAQAIQKALAGEKVLELKDLTTLPDPGQARRMTTGGHYAYLKIAEGCDKCCTYCIIPKVRGRYRSIPMEKLLAQAENLAGQGVKELILVAQETTLYGKDLYGHKCLHLLLEGLCRIPGLFWIRILYCYPEEIYPELIDTIQKEEKICHYLDIPIQHASDRILKRMGRRTSKEDLIRIIAQLREAIPDITLRTTLISGFPGESQEDHEELMDFVDQMEFDRLGVFPYSQEEDTPAALMPDQIDEEIKVQRQEALMELQQEIAFALTEDKIGQTLEVMIEGEIPEDHVYVGRTAADAPGVDGLIFVHSGERFMTGDFVRVRVTGAAEYDLIGEVEDEFTE